MPVRAAKRLLKRAAIQCGLELIALQATGGVLRPAGRGIVFTLHHVRPDRDLDFEPNAILAVTPAFLEGAIVEALANGLVPIALEDLPRRLADPTDDRRFICFTLDDGYRDNATYAAPVFRKHHIPYTVFVTSGFVDRSRTIWWETAEQLIGAVDAFEFDFGQGRELVRTGSRLKKFGAFERLAAFVNTSNEDQAVARIDRVAHANGIDAVAIVQREVMNASELQRLAEDPLARFGAHSVSHVNLSRVDAARLRHELDESAARLAHYVGRRPTSFAYPYGWRHAVGAREAEAAAAAGFAIAVTTQPGVLTSLDPPLQIKRVSLNGHYQKSRYVRALVSGLPFDIMPRVA